MTDAPIKDAPMQDASIQDASASHWVYRLPQPARSFAQLSRLDRPVGYWLLALPGWIGLAFASLSTGFGSGDLKWAALILIGAIAMRGAGCTYNDIVDQDLDAKVERTALRPLPAGTITNKQAWIWLLAQCAVGLIVLLCLPRLAQIISLCSIPFVAAYPFMKRITWWPQVWLGFTMNWAVLVAYAIKTGSVSPAVIILYTGLMFWTVGYDTIYACQDIEDDAMIGVKSTARRFGSRVKLGVGICYGVFVALVILAVHITYFVEIAPPLAPDSLLARSSLFFHDGNNYYYINLATAILVALPLALHLVFQLVRFNPKNAASCLRYFKSNTTAAGILIVSMIMFTLLYPPYMESVYNRDGHLEEIFEQKMKDARS